MKEKMKSLLLPIGLLLFAAYRILDGYIEISNAIAYPWMIISIICELIGIFYNGRCLGQKKSPCAPRKSKKE